jgi:hypothetical protein
MKTTGNVIEGGNTNQNDLGFVKFLLYAHNIICMPWVLVLLNVIVDLRERDCGRIGKGRLWNLCREIIKKLGEKGESWSDRVLLVGDDHSYGGGRRREL